MYLFSGISLFFSRQFKNTFMLQFKAFCNVFNIGPNFWAPRETGSTMAIKLKATSSELVAGIFMTLQNENI